MYILGGIGNWGKFATYKLNFSNLPPHFAFEIRMKFYFIDSWDLLDDSMEIFINNLTFAFNNYEYYSRNENFIGGFTKDKFELLSFHINSTSSEFLMELRCLVD